MRRFSGPGPVGSGSIEHVRCSRNLVRCTHKLRMNDELLAASWVVEVGELERQFTCVIIERFSIRQEVRLSSQINGDGHSLSKCHN